MYVLVGNDRCHKEGPVVCKGRRSDQGPALLSTPSSAPNHPPFLTHSSTCDCFSRRDQENERMFFIEDDQFLSFLFLFHQTRSIQRKGLSIHCVTYVYQQDCVCSTWKLQRASFVSRTLKTLKLPLNEASNSCHFKIVLVVSIQFWDTLLCNL